IVDTDDDGELVEVKGIVEKPAPEDAPSNRGVVGRYILTSEIFNQLAQTGKGAGDEIQLTDGIARLMQEEKVMAYAFKGVRYDCGSKLGYLKATVDYALKHDHLGDEFKAWLRERFIK
ncbi:MAG: sugar phosphate nucleotidyltransferase, partial [Sedimenticola sp.]